MILSLEELGIPKQGAFRAIFSPERHIEDGLFEWKNKPEQWLNPWLEKYVGYRIDDMSFVPGLLTIEQLKLSYQVREEFAIANWPKATLDRFFKKDNWIVANDSRGNPIERDFLTYSEYLRANSELTSEEQLEIGEAISKKLSRIEPHKEVSKELPVKLKIFGDGVYNFVAAFSHVDDASNFVKALVENPSWKLLESKGIFSLS